MKMLRYKNIYYSGVIDLVITEYLKASDIMLDTSLEFRDSRDKTVSLKDFIKVAGEKYYNQLI